MSRRAPGEGAIYRDKRRGVWVGQASAGVNPVTGKRRRVKVSGRNQTEVARKLKARLADMERLSVSDSPTVGELLDLWINREAPKTMSAKTLSIVESMVDNHLRPTLGRTKAAELRVEDFEALLDAKAANLARSSLVKLHSYLSQAYDAALRRRLVVWNPARVAVVPLGARPREGRALTAAELRSLFVAAASDRLNAWIVLGASLGLRPGELSGLEWDAIDMDLGVVHVMRSLTWIGGDPVLKPTKTNKPRTLSLPAVAVDALVAHRRAQAEERLLMGSAWPRKWASLVFVNTAGNPLDPANVRRLVRSLAIDAGIEGAVRPYDLRHTATSLLSAAGAAPELLADLLGNVDTRMVFKHYRHPVTPTVDVAALHFANAMGTYSGPSVDALSQTLDMPR